MKKTILVVLALTCAMAAQVERRVPSLPIDNVPVHDNDAVTKKYVDDRTPPLATNGTNCAAGEFPKGVDEFGNVEDCTPVDTTTDLTWPLTSNTANPASVGQFRLAYADQIAWRNALNTANYTLNPDADGNLVWSGNGFLSSGSGASYWEGSVGTPSVASAGKGRISFSSVANRPVWSYDGGAQETLAFVSEAGGSAPTFIDGEAPSGTINGSNTGFTLAAAPSPATSLKCFVNGIRQRYTTDFSVSSTTLTMVTAPATGDSLVCDYRY
jgi:hypothetical protein